MKNSWSLRLPVCLKEFRNLSTPPLQKKDLADDIKSIGDAKIASILMKLHALLLEWDYRITDLQNTVTDLERRNTEQEIYSSKDSMVIENLPIKDGMVSISEQI